MAAPVNLHQQRSRATKESLRRVALERFKRDGFANVTVTALAAEAGVTERTFFRHFPTKEAVLFEDYETQLEWLAEALARRPASENLFDAVLASVVSFPHDLEVVRQAALLRAELIGGEKAAGHLRVVQASFAEVITAFVRSRYAELLTSTSPRKWRVLRWPRRLWRRSSTGAEATVSAISARSSRPVSICCVRASCRSV